MFTTVLFVHGSVNCSLRKMARRQGITAETMASQPRNEEESRVSPMARMPVFILHIPPKGSIAGIQMEHK